LRGLVIPAGKKRYALAGTGCSSHNFAGEERQKTVCIHVRDSQGVLLRLEGFGNSLQSVWPT
ncbi:unnamed protein product, partial [Ectocarpus sp. 4 AP-2014]